MMKQYKHLIFLVVENTISFNMFTRTYFKSNIQLLKNYNKAEIQSNTSAEGVLKLILEKLFP